MLFHDVKPSNVAIGDDDENKIFFFDFAFSIFHVNALGESKHREKADEMNGTPEYFAYGPLQGLTHVRKDELFSFGLILLELNGVYFPWMDKTDDDDHIYTAMNIVFEEWEKYTLEVSEFFTNSTQSRFGRRNIN